MKRLSKHQMAKHAELTARANDARDALNAAIREYNRQVKDMLSWTEAHARARGRTANGWPVSEQDKMQAVMDSFPTSAALSYGRADYAAGSNDEAPPERVVVVLQFSEKGFGFGEVTIIQTPEGAFLDTECMSVERVKKYFALLLDGAIADHERDPVKHALYNRVMGRTCSVGCAVCHPGSP